MKTNLLSLVLILIISAACSYHWREGDTGVDYDTMVSQMNGFLGTEGASAVGNVTGSANEFSALANNEGAGIYFAQPGSLGPVFTIAAVDYASLGFQTVDETSVEDVQVFFVDAETENGRTAGLMVAARSFGESSSYEVHVFTAVGPSDVSGGVYTTTLTNGQVTITLQSYDVERGGGLQSVIQLRVYNDADERIGKFPTLVGYLP